MTGGREAGAAVLPRSFFDGPALEVAPRLLGCVLRHDSPDGPVAMVITEVEAYAGPDDPASHAYRGQTARNAVMFGPPGYVYVYFTYGMHFCANLVCQPAGSVSAILLRAGRIIEGADLAATRRWPQPAAGPVGYEGPGDGVGLRGAATGGAVPGGASPGGAGPGGAWAVPVRAVPVRKVPARKVPGRAVSGLAVRCPVPPEPEPEPEPGAGPGARDPRRVAPRDLAGGQARLCQALGIDRGLNGADACDPASPLRVLAAPPGAAPAGQVCSGPRIGISQAADRPWRFWLAGEPSVTRYRVFTPRRRSR